jgi:hypothetical protein
MLAVSACALAAIPGAPAQAAFARASLGVNVQVLEDCSALLSSSTTIIQASFACQGSAVEATLSPTVTSTSLAILAPGVLLGQQSFHTAPGDSAQVRKHRGDRTRIRGRHLGRAGPE